MSELVVLLKKNKMLFSARSMKMEEHLSGMIGALGLEDLSFLLQEIAEVEPRKIVKAIPSLLKELETTAMKHKVMIVGVWSVAVSGSGCWFWTLAASAEQLGWGVWCCPSVAPQLFIPFFKLLTVVASSGEEPAMQCLLIVSKIAKSGLVTGHYTFGQICSFGEH